MLENLCDVRKKHLIEPISAEARTIRWFRLTRIPFKSTRNLDDSDWILTTSTRISGSSTFHQKLTAAKSCSQILFSHVQFANGTAIVNSIITNAEDFSKRLCSSVFTPKITGHSLFVGARILLLPIQPETLLPITWRERRPCEIVDTTRNIFVFRGRMVSENANWNQCPT